MRTGVKAGKKAMVGKQLHYQQEADLAPKRPFPVVWNDRCTFSKRNAAAN